MYLYKLLQEGLVLALVTLCVYLLMALLSYDPRDPGWSSTGSMLSVNNLAGRTGAWVADVLYYFFGKVAFVFPAVLANQAWVIFQRRKAQQVPMNWPIASLRLGGLVLVVVTLSPIFEIYLAQPFLAGPGGVLGAGVASGLIDSFNLLGATLLLVSLFLFGITVVTGVSWFFVMDSIGAFTLRAVALAPRNGRQLAAWGQTAMARLRTVIPWLVRYFRPMPEQDLPTAGKTTGAKTGEGRRKRNVGPLNAQTKARQQPLDSVSREPVQDARVPAAEDKPSPELTLATSHTAASQRAEMASRMVSQQAGDDPDSPIPSRQILDPMVEDDAARIEPEKITRMSRLLEAKLKDFGISAEVVEVHPGPVVTRFEIQPAPGIKVSRITNLVKDLARSLAVISVRVVEVIPGKSNVGIEVPNAHRQIVRLREILYSRLSENASSPLTVALGNDIAGFPVIANLAKMPHLLVAGTTGSGKSVGVNAMLLSILLKATPEEVRLILIDPKILELSIYEGIPHLLTPVVTDMKDAANTLRWCVAEMERRYRLMAALGVRNLAGCNRKIKAGEESGEPLTDPLWNRESDFSTRESPPLLEPIPYIVVVVDEFADLIMVVGKKVEELIARIAQKARAAGIHLILATQRPSVDVITGIIKANIPTRVAFQVSSKVDSRTILDQGGAEQLLGQGDMLYLPPGSGLPVRVHGAFVADDEVKRVVDAWKMRREPEYLDEVLVGGPETPEADSGHGAGGGEQDALYDDAVAFVTGSRKASISAVQRKLRIGYNRAANLVEAMEGAGIVSSSGHNGMREVLVAPPPEV